MFFYFPDPEFHVREVSPSCLVSLSFTATDENLENFRRVLRYPICSSIYHCLTPTCGCFSILNVVYPGDSFGLPLKVTKSVIVGIITEISRAAVAPKWERQMLDHLSTKGNVDPQVIEFYLMGKRPDSDVNAVGVKGFKTEKVAEKVKDTVEAVRTMSIDSPGEDHYKTEKARSDFDPKKNQFDYVEADFDFSSCLNQLTIRWTWGMKFLFQRFTLRKDVKNKWHLWPFMQPKVNNRDIDVTKLYNTKSNDSTFIEAIYTKQEIGFDVQAPHCTLYSLKPSTHDQSLGTHLEAMVNGPSCSESRNDLEFKDLTAGICTLDDMDKCYQAIVVSYLDYSHALRVSSKGHH